MEDSIPKLAVKEANSERLLAYRQSALFNFVDWICIDSEGQLTSSATLGYSDMGKNRELVEEIRQHCSAAL